MKFRVRHVVDKNENINRKKLKRLKTDNNNQDNQDGDIKSIYLNLLCIGSLWIGDVILLKNEIKKYFKKNYSLVGAIALGYSKPQPKHRGRKSLEKVCEFL